MKDKKLYTLLILLPALMLIIAFSFNGKALSDQTASAQENLAVNQKNLLPQEIVKQSKLDRTPAAYSNYTRITDETETISVDVPVEWIDIDSGPWTYKGRSSGFFLAASTDLSKFNADGSASGVLIGVSNQLVRTYGKDGLLGAERADMSRRCTYAGNFNYEGLFYKGRYDDYSKCGSGSANIMVFTTTSADQKLLIMVRVAIQSDADLDAASKILETFQVLGDPEVDPHHDH